MKKPVATYILLAVMLFFNVRLQAQIISTIAGNGYGQGTGTGGFSGDGSAATSAELNFPWGVAVDDSGNAYIADEYNNRIRKVSAATGTITTFAGTGAQGFSGDSGLATDAVFYYPTAVALDTSGNLYIADRLNSRIREVIKKTGIIYTIAGSKYIIGGKGFTGDGGPATACNLSQPFGVAVDDSGNVYIDDYNNDRIRKVTRATGIINTIGGNGTQGFTGDSGPATAAELDFPLGVAVDDSFNIYIGDYISNRVRKIKASTGIITTIAGSGAQGYSGDGGPATDAGFYHTEGVAVDKWDNVYVADFYNNVIRKIDQSTGIVTTFAGDGYGAGNGYGGWHGDGGPAVNAELWFPVGVGVSDSGNVYIADNYNNRIRKVTVCNANLAVNPYSYLLCSGQNVTLAASGANSYTWIPATGLSATTGSSVVANPTVTITYTIAGTSACGSSNTQVAVTVVQPPNKPTITISVTGDTLFSSATNSNQWYVNGSPVNGAIDSEFVITGLPHGDSVTVSVTNVANGCSTTSGVYITGIDQLSLISNQLSIYPNPANGMINVTISSAIGELVGWNLQIVDVLGRIIYAQTLLMHKNEIDVSGLPGGMYFITVLNNTARAVVPVVKQ